MTDILVLVDHDAGRPRKVANQILTAARQLGGQVQAAVFGPGAADSAAALGSMGVTTAHVWEDGAAVTGATETLTAALLAAVDASGAGIVLYAADPFTTDVVARAAVRSGGGVVADAVDLEIRDDRMVATKAIFGGDIRSQCQVRGDRTQFVGVKANAFQAEPVGGPPAAVVPLAVSVPPAAGRMTIIDVVEADGAGRPEMTEASIICAGGRGLGGDQGFHLIEALADELGAAVGASRAATDAGWYPHNHQIGQTGKTVSPQLYIGSGISGAIQHRAGMQTSQTIAVINSDADAPIFSIADFGVVGDLHKVVPALIEELRARKGPQGR